MQILETNRSHIIYKNENGIVDIVPNTPYFRLKILEYKGERIKHDIPIEGIEIMETFNGMIFNISINGQTITTRPNMADEVVASFHDVNKLYEIFDEYNNNKYNVKLLESVLKKYEGRIKIINSGFIVDDLFLVDRVGVCWLWDSEKQVKNQSHKTNLGSGAICIVVNKAQRLKLNIEGTTIIIDEMGYIILSKIEFLLNPNLTDNVFTHQLPSDVLKILQINQLK